MIFTTTGTVEGREIDRYLGVVFGGAVLGVNVFRDLLGGLRDIVGGRSGTYERELGTARDTAMAALAEQACTVGADAVIGIDIDYEVLGSNNGMLMVSASGPAVTLKGGGAAPATSPWTRPA